MLPGTYRRTIRLDRASKTVGLQKSVAGIVYQSATQTLGTFDRIALGHFMRSRGESGGRLSVYYAQLSGTSSLQLIESSTVQKTRTVAERAAAFLNLPLHDSTTGTLIIRAPEMLSLSVTDRGRISEQQLDTPVPPSGLQSEVDFPDSSTAVIRIPAAGWSWRITASMLPMFLFGCFLIWLMHDVFAQRRVIGEYVLAAIVLTTGGLCAVGTLSMVLGWFTKRTSIRVSGQEVVIESVSWIRRRVQRIDATGILEVVAYDLQKLRGAPGQSRPDTDFTYGGVGIRTRRETIRFGKHLSYAEQTFIRQLITSFLQKHIVV